ncbi:MAG: hypothetical protein B6I20_04010 [Bacteroidetes bacterium 4572_117]|nr:MAG: hypothetical protein B6I20_04010 [Bacteroidetes bacterium 4572_117]
MRKILLYFVISGIALNFFNIKAQNTILLISGKKLEIGEFKLSDDMFLLYKNKKGKNKFADLRDVFSVKEQNGKETIFYNVDSTDIESFTINQMRSFVNGSFDARSNYKNPWVITGGFVVGAGSAVAVSVVGLNTIIAPVFPALYSGGVGIIKKNKFDLPDKFKSNPHYMAGYKRAANHKRINNAIIGSGIGMALGIVAIIVFK